jgi:hypothetical protein
VSRVETLKKFIEAHPSDPFPRYGLAQEYKNTGRFDEARGVFERGIEACRRRGDGHAMSELEGALSAFGE